MQSQRTKAYPRTGRTLERDLLCLIGLYSWNQLMIPYPRLTINNKLQAPPDLKIGQINSKLQNPNLKQDQNPIVWNFEF